MKLVQFFAKNPVFRLSQLEAYFDTVKQHNKNTQRELVTYHIKQQNIVRIRRGLFATIPPAIKSQHFIPDPYLIAGLCVDDAVLAFHTAFNFYGVSYSAFETFYSLTQTKTSNFIHKNMSFKTIGHSKTLLTKNQENLFINKIE